MNEERIEELEKRVYTLEHRADKHDLRIENVLEKADAIGKNISQLWLFIKNYLFVDVRKIGSIKFSKKQLTTFLLSFVLWLCSIVLRFFDVI